MDMLSSFGVDYYISRTDTATGGCLDMAKHLKEEVLTKKHEAKAKLTKTLKYVSRADNISRGVPGLDKLMAADRGRPCETGRSLSVKVLPSPALSASGFSRSCLAFVTSVIPHVHRSPFPHDGL